MCHAISLPQLDMPSCAMLCVIYNILNCMMKILMHGEQSCLPQNTTVMCANNCTFVLFWKVCFKAVLYGIIGSDYGVIGQLYLGKGLHFKVLWIRCGFHNDWLNNLVFLPSHGSLA